MAQASVSARSLMDEQPTDLNYRLWLAVAGSLLLHAGVLALATWIRLPHHSERPLAAIEVSLASEPSQPSPPVKPVDPPKTQVKTTPKATVAAPPPPPVKAPAVSSAAPPPPPPSVTQPAKEILDQDVVHKMELPPDAPKLGDLSPAERPLKRPFKLPEVPVVSEPTEPVKKAWESKSRPSLVEEVNRQLEQELRNVKNVELSQAASSESPAKTVPQVEAKAPSVTAVDTTLKVAGVAQGSNAYLSRVRQRVSSFWSAPPVDVTGQAYVVVVRFRLHRDGSVTGVAIERSSGNEYYDLAGQRAVLAARPLPPFPPNVAESYYDVYFTFAVGETQG
ncbi:MAG: TonB family protein [Nitrospira sp.]|nr:TonB family protein [Nitrospira sp.]